MALLRRFFGRNVCRGFTSPTWRRARHCTPPPKSRSSPHRRVRSRLAVTPHAMAALAAPHTAIAAAASLSHQRKLQQKRPAGVTARTRQFARRGTGCRGVKAKNGAGTCINSHRDTPPKPPRSWDRCVFGSFPIPSPTHRQLFNNPWQHETSAADKLDAIPGESVSDGFGREPSPPRALPGGGRRRKGRRSTPPPRTPRRAAVLPSAFVFMFLPKISPLPAFSDLSSSHPPRSCSSGFALSPPLSLSSPHPPLPGAPGHPNLNLG